MCRRVLVILLITLAPMPPLARLRAADAPAKSIDSATVQASLKRGTDYLWLVQKDDGGWEEKVAQNCGVSSLVVLALLNCGENSDSPRMRKAFNYLRRKEPQATYSVALQTMAFCAAASRTGEDLTLIERNCNWLIENQLGSGGWSYPSGGGDPSNSQFALLALHEGQRAGVRLDNDPAVNAERWKKCFAAAEKYWHQLQNADGSFPYDRDSRGSMTCAGIASMIITATELSSREARDDGQQLACCGAADDSADRVQSALRWLSTNYQIEKNPRHEGYHFYYLYALERAGRMTGSRFIGRHDWYREGARVLLSQQQPDGPFESFSLFERADRIVNTSFALLFLAKGKRQIVVSRLEHGRGNDWNHHRQALQNLTLHTESVWKRDLAWQTVDVAQATLADLLETPVLFISGSQAIKLTDAQQDTLRQYVEQGGFIFVEACNQDGCQGVAFEQEFSKVVQRIFDQPLEKLSPDHPLWNAEARVDPQALPHDFWLYGVQSCCRLALVYSPISLSCRWELNRPYGAPVERPEKLQAELDNATKLGVNVLSYATGKQLKEKLDTVSILEGSLTTPPSDRGTLIIPNLEHGGGAEEAPKALPNLLLWLGRENPFQISNQRRMISVDETELRKYPHRIHARARQFSFH